MQHLELPVRQIRAEHVIIAAPGSQGDIPPRTYRRAIWAWAGRIYTLFNCLGGLASLWLPTWQLSRGAKDGGRTTA